MAQIPHDGVYPVLPGPVSPDVDSTPVVEGAPDDTQSMLQDGDIDVTEPGDAEHSALEHAVVAIGSMTGQLSILRPLCLALGAGLVLCMFAISWLLTRPPQITLTTGEAPLAIADTALDLPVPNSSQWTRAALFSALCRDDWRMVAQARPWFNDLAWARLSQLAQPGQDGVDQIVGNPVLASSGVEAGVMTWHYDVTVRHWREQDAKLQAPRQVIHLVVARRAQHDDPAGLVVTGLDAG